MEPEYFKDFIAIYDNVLSPEECDSIINQFESCGLAEPGQTGSGVDQSKKNSMDITLNAHEEWRESGQNIFSKVCPFVLDYMGRLKFPLIEGVGSVETPQGIIPATVENWEELKAHKALLFNFKYEWGYLNIQKYFANEGGYYKWHSEVNPSIKPPLRALYRAYFWILYLNTVESGGETQFYHQNFAVKPKAGRLLIATGNSIHTHRGNIPNDIDKYIATSWVMYKPKD